ncbi:GAF and ANTAR domain-containing protein [Amycolatopsis magusensis]|uniref:GAF and ANTAR domain-containing protein n=1 Tax=Amycolatopsis magusensis TaxID=882444 RepID=UPI0024A94DEB|nr:GAF and ANTAR domain-containing protein [Amycolatopsis magusensis]MDI5980663.1 GAF and ANTAR domain-containing protein [Amycolatopsis magusensis]
MTDRTPERTGSAVTSVLGGITARLVEGSDSEAVLRLVVDAGVELMGAAASGVMVVDPRGGLDVLAASDTPANLVELLQAQVEHGPCVECVEAGEVVAAEQLARERTRWPEFVPVALELGYHAVIAVPMWLDGNVVGGLNVLYAEEQRGDADLVRLGRVLADLAVLGLVQERGQRRADRLTEHTLSTLDDRVYLGQAIGIVAGTLGTTPAAASALLSGYAVRTRQTLRVVVRAVADGVLDPGSLA